jgi:cobalamin transport system substrate-binding protein
VDARIAAASRRTQPLSLLLPLLVALALSACTTGAATPASSTATAPPSVAVSPSATTAPSTAPSEAPTTTAQFPVTVTDDEGTDVTIEAEPSRIVTLTPAVTETLFAMGVGDRIVGKSEDVLLYPPQASAVPDVEKFDGSAIVVDTEQIVAAHADLVIAGGNFGTPPDAIQKLRELGLPVVVVYAPTVDAVYADIRLLGQATGRTAEADAMVASMMAAFDAVSAAVADAPKPRVYYELDATGAYYGPSDDSFLAEMISLAGGDPVTTGSPDKYDIAPERLLEADPEVILLADAAYGVTAGDVAARPGWSAMTAVRNGDIRPIDDTTITRPGPRLFRGLELLASTIHPELSIPVASPIPPAP